MTPAHDDTVARLRHLVGLNEPENGGPYQGIAAQACMTAMSEAATLLLSYAERIKEMEEALEDIATMLEADFGVGHDKLVDDCVAEARRALNTSPKTGEKRT